MNSAPPERGVTTPPAPYYSDSLVTLYQGQCLDLLESNTFTTLPQIVVTSPPYNMGAVPGGGGRGMYRPGANSKGGRFRNGYSEADDDALEWPVYDTLRRDELAAMWRNLPNDGAIYYNHRPRVIHGVLRDPLQGDFGIPLRNRIIWDRKTGIGPNLRHYCSVAEYVYLFAKPEFKLVDHSASGRGDIWRLGVAQEDFGHPAPFPVSLPMRAITDTAARSVLDPFAGTGTTLLAATIAGIPSVGFEKEERYCEVIAKRLQDNQALFGGVA